MLNMNILFIENTSATPFAEMALELGSNESISKFFISGVSHLVSAIRNIRISAFSLLKERREHEKRSVICGF